MEGITVPEDYEERLAAARTAAARMPEGPTRTNTERVLAQAPTREAAALAELAAARAAALAEHVTGAGFDGTDPGRVVWLRLDYTGRLESLALSPTVDRMSGRAVAEAIEAAWEAAEAARAEHVMRVERAGADLLSRCAPDPRSAELRERVARSSERFAGDLDEDDLCEAEVTLAGCLSRFRFLVPNATVDIDYEQLAAEAAAAIGRAQRRAADRLGALCAAAIR